MILPRARYCRIRSTMNVLRPACRAMLLSMVATRGRAPSRVAISRVAPENNAMLTHRLGGALRSEPLLSQRPVEHGRESIGTVLCRRERETSHGVELEQCERHDGRRHVMRLIANHHPERVKGTRVDVAFGDRHDHTYHNVVLGTNLPLAALHDTHAHSGTEPLEACLPLIANHRLVHQNERSALVVAHLVHGEHGLASTTRERHEGAIGSIVAKVALMHHLVRTHLCLVEGSLKHETFRCGISHGAVVELGSSIPLEAVVARHVQNSILQNIRLKGRRGLSKRRLWLQGEVAFFLLQNLLRET